MPHSAVSKSRSCWVRASVESGEHLGRTGGEEMGTVFISHLVCDPLDLQHRLLLSPPLLYSPLPSSPLHSSPHPSLELMLLESRELLEQWHETPEPKPRGNKSGLSSQMSDLPEERRLIRADGAEMLPVLYAFSFVRVCFSLCWYHRASALYVCLWNEYHFPLCKNEHILSAWKSYGSTTVCSRRCVHR